MNCPKCEGVTLTRVRVADLEVDHCNDCGGLWCDRSELSRLLELKPSEVRDLRRGRVQSGANTRRGKCPQCGTELLRVASAVQRRVTVDKCPDCGGVWLDGGEFDALFAAGS